MIPYFPKQIAVRAIAVYFAALVLISVVFYRYSMPVWRMGMGLAFVAGFFLLSSSWGKAWVLIQEKQFIGKLFSAALIIRIVWVIVSYYYYMAVNGNPFEFDAADAQGYHTEAEWLASVPWSVAWDYCFGDNASGISDVGYPLYLTFLYKIFGPYILIPRFIKCLLSAWMCILIYRLSSRTFGERVGRIAGIMCCLMPNLIIYCGYHLKETEMVFLEVAFLERLDYVMRNRNFQLWNILLPTLLAGSLFFFRTVLGGAAVLAFASAVVFSNTPSMKKGGRRAVLIGWGILALTFTVGTTAMNEVELYWEQKDSNVELKRAYQTSRGNQWAKYATGSVMAPMIVALPFSTMVVTEGQESQITRHGGNYVRNFMAFFALLAIIEAVRQKKWRSFALIGTFTFGYLGVIAISGFSNSERFLLPGLPGLIMMWAYGISELRKNTYSFLAPWCVIVVIMEIGWAYFKLGSRGLF